jgi:hypothetical protein
VLKVAGVVAALLVIGLLVLIGISPATTGYPLEIESSTRGFTVSRYGSVISGSAEPEQRLRWSGYRDAMNFIRALSRVIDPEWVDSKLYGWRRTEATQEDILCARLGITVNDGVVYKTSPRRELGPLAGAHAAVTTPNRYLGRSVGIASVIFLDGKIYERNLPSAQAIRKAEVAAEVFNAMAQRVPPAG